MIRPSPEQVKAYALSIGFDLEGDKFCDFYEMKGWKVGKNPMVDWKAAVRTWKRMANPDKREQERRHQERRARDLPPVQHFNIPDEEIVTGEMFAELKKELLKNKFKMKGLIK